MARLLPFYSPEEVGEMLNITPRTVKYHSAKLRRKLDVSTTKEVLKYLYEHGLLSYN